MKLRLRLYWAFVKVAFRSRLAYRAEVSLLLVSRVMTLFVQVAIWQALLGAEGHTESTIGS